MYRRRILTVLGMLAVGHSVGSEPSTGRTSPQTAAGTSGRRFRGQGPKRTDSFALEDGVTTVRFDHDGESTFQTALVGSDTATSDGPLVDSSGDVDGGRALVTEAGSYAFEITATGAWTVEYAQPDGVDPALPPHTDSGSGVGYTGPVLLNRTTELIGTHHGDGSFSIWGHTADGERRHLVETSGTTEEWTSTRIEGTTWFDIEADGEWELDVF